MAGFFKSRLFFVALAIVIIASTLPLYVSGYVLGLLTVAPPVGLERATVNVLLPVKFEFVIGTVKLFGDTSPLAQTSVPVLAV